ncbi:MAG: hypothetical protein AB1689_19475, partial [Thermodesulfobacteriota bacterium]
MPSPYAEELRGDLGAVVRHAIARAAFMRELCTHPRVVEASARWGEESGIHAAAREYAKARDDYAQALGFGGRADILRPDFADVELLARIEKPAETERLRALLDGAEETYTRVRAATHVDPTALVRELVPSGWPWVIGDLIGAFYRGLLSHVFGVQVVQQFVIEKHDARTWRLASQYTVGASAVLKVIPAPDGSRLPREKLDAIERNARWFYRARVLRDKADDLAQEHCEEERVKLH